MRQKKQPYTQAQINRVCDIMPRKAPKEVIEHRITLGDFERKQLVEAIDSYRRDKVLENIPNYFLGVAGIGVAGAVGLVAYAFYKWCDLDLDLFTAAKNFAMDIDNGFTSVVTGNPLHSAVAAGNSATNEKEVLEAYNPAIAKVEAQILMLQNAPNFPNKEKMIQNLNKTKGQLELMRRVALSRVGAPNSQYGGAPGRRPIEELAVQRGYVSSLAEAQALSDEELSALFN